MQVKSLFEVNHMKWLSRFLLVSVLFVGSSLAAEAPKIPVILDTDIGTDIDDAFALALIIDSPEFDLLGVTTVSGDTAARARLAAKMLVGSGRKVAAGPSRSRRARTGATD